MIFSSLIIGAATDELVEDVIVPLHRALRYHPALLQKVVDDLTALDQVLVIEDDFHPLSEARRVVLHGKEGEEREEV